MEQAASGQMDVAARTWSWSSNAGLSSGGWEQVDSPGSQRKEGVATSALQNLSTDQRREQKQNFLSKLNSKCTPIIRNIFKRTHFFFLHMNNVSKLEVKYRWLARRQVAHRGPLVFLQSCESDSVDSYVFYARDASGPARCCCTHSSG